MEGITTESHRQLFLKFTNQSNIVHHRRHFLRFNLSHNLRIDVDCLYHVSNQTKLLLFLSSSLRTCSVNFRMNICCSNYICITKTISETLHVKIIRYGLSSYTQSSLPHSNNIYLFVI